MSSIGTTHINHYANKYTVPMELKIIVDLLATDFNRWLKDVSILRIYLKLHNMRYLHSP